jgi:hypothetical protein
MKKVIESFITFLISLVGLIGSIFWIYQSGWQAEPLIIGSVSLLEIIGFLFVKLMSKENKTDSKNFQNNQQLSKNTSQEGEMNFKKNQPENQLNREAMLDSMKLKKKILFIDDDKNFNVVKILKDSGWKYTRTVIDIKTLDMSIVKESDMLFVDINGVGNLLGLENGLDLALMLKQKYPEKKVVIYSANKNSNAFHKAWDVCDYKLEKNALPYQFQNLVEEYSLQNLDS